jgi:ribosome-interacting GTPase 1
MLTQSRVSCCAPAQNELEGFGIRLNKSPPNLTFKRKERGGINLTSTVRLAIQ